MKKDSDIYIMTLKSGENFMKGGEEMNFFEARNSLTLKKVFELTEVLEEKNLVKSFEFFKEKDKFFFYQNNIYKIECSNRILVVRVSESGEFIVIYEKFTSNASQKHEYNLTKYELNAASAAINKILKDFEKNQICL